MRPLRLWLIALTVFAVAMPLSLARSADPLPSWNDSLSKTRIVEFVNAVTDRSRKDYVAPAERVATAIFSLRHLSHRPL